MLSSFLSSSFLNSSVTCTYKSIVICRVACPRYFCTVLGSIPAPIHLVAKVRRKYRKQFNPIPLRCPFCYPQESVALSIISTHSIHHNRYINADLCHFITGGNGGTGAKNSGWLFTQPECLFITLLLPDILSFLHPKGRNLFAYSYNSAIIRT